MRFFAIHRVTCVSLDGGTSGAGLADNCSIVFSSILKLVVQENEMVEAGICEKLWLMWLVFQWLEVEVAIDVWPYMWSEIALVLAEEENEMAEAECN